MTNNKKAKIEFLLNNTPEILLDQFVNIVKLILYFNKATPSVRKNNEFINDAYNSINVISKLICMISNDIDTVKADLVDVYDTDINSNINIRDLRKKHNTSNNRVKDLSLNLSFYILKNNVWRWITYLDYGLSN